MLVSPPEQVAFNLAQLPRFSDRDETAIGPLGRRERWVGRGKGGEQDRDVAFRGVDPG